MAAEQGRARGKASAATATRVQNALIDGSLCGILERLDEDRHSIGSSAAA